MISGKTRLACLCVAALAMAGARADAANLLSNGSFESPDVTLLFLNPGSTTITGWTVAAQAGSAPGTQVSPVDNAAFGALGVVASHGSQFVDLTGNVGRGGGVVSNAFATGSGASYRASFDVGAFFVGGQGSYGNVTVDLFVNNSFVQSFTNIMSLQSAGSDWQRFSWDFAGTGSPMTIGLFSSLSTASSNLGVGLDNVSVDLLSSAVPEPATWALMVGGLGLAGGMMRRRKMSAVLA
ncbi:PEPxxWA-CTERM sorting domain-containing protein [Sphingobium nicotianae]|uniref:PEPxxWA-CTERM sorting domain-containing protein n=1 Tax=Sphingobium nicotianae TaxID=2782607 RepID=A0A9X1D9Q2_9SPHN|nr:PEPxxWA-CTERM sorting domain-containing protein [Sphingobium nicotianae]MBT2185966.1 PEPxxWA-CTERM sorting domain-containing protein [Sphingobium nicotianae]